MTLSIWNVWELLRLILKFRFMVFLTHGITSDYDGVIGLNFLGEHKFCIDIGKGEVSVDISAA